jgi:cysteine desulfurase
MKRIYLDYAATTPVHPEVLEEMLPYFTEKFGNPSTLYSYGREAKNKIENAREIIADFIGAAPSEIVFTSGGTESDNYAIIGVADALKEKGNHIITTSIEHHAVLYTCQEMEKRGFKVTYLPVDRYGFVSPSDVESAITDKTILITIMHANNEVGTIQEIEKIGEIAKEKGIVFHTDAVQSLGHIPVDVNKLKVDLLSASAHKLYGPKGVGFLYIRRGTKINKILFGGHQERNLRSGTENVPAIIGFGKAIEIAKKEMEKEGKRLIKMRDNLIKEILKIPDTSLNGHPEKRLPNNVNISFKYIEGEALLLKLDLEGICAASGSACSSSLPVPSHVLSAMGIEPEVARSSLRFTLGRYTEEDDLKYVVEVLKKAVENLREISPIKKFKK